jgi:trehalose 6-phosphate synthase
MSRLIVISNRLPDLAGAPPCGGLVSGLDGLLRTMGGLWVGWSGRSEPSGRLTAAIRDGEAYATLPVNLPHEDIEGYYHGFANATLWPICHHRVDLAEIDGSTYRAYRKVNADLARLVAGVTRRGDTIWVHDYHLIPLGLELRRRGVTNRIGFFLHVPVPPRETLAVLPWAEELVAALTAYDLVGLQTIRDWSNLADFALRELDGELGDDGAIALRAGRLAPRVYPIGIDTSWFASSAAASAETERAPTAPQPAERTLLGVDRLDYSKGVPERLRAFGELLERHPEYRRRVQMVQVSAPSREDVPAYGRLRREVAEISGDINGRLGDLDWTPVCFINQALPQTRLAKLYRASTVGMVTPLADGMNLVAKEYVACQDPDEPGVLVLSRFAGAAEQMSGAVLVNPHDRSGMIAALRKALAMPVEERRARWRSMMALLERDTVHRWGRDFVADLREPDRPVRAPFPVRLPRPPAPPREIAARRAGGGHPRPVLPIRPSHVPPPSE